MWRPPFALPKLATHWITDGTWQYILMVTQQPELRMFNKNDKQNASEIKEVSVSFGNHSIDLRGTIILPTDASEKKPAPGAVLCHGFGGAHRAMRASAQIMASQGIATLIFDFRGHGSSGGTVDGRMVEDVVDAWDFLSSLPEVDNSRMGLIGHSLGAMSAIMAAERVVNPKALVSLCCPPEADSQLLASGANKPGQWGKDGCIVEYPRHGAFPWLKGMAALICRIWMYLACFKVRVDWPKFIAAFPSMKMSEVLQELRCCPKLFVFCEGDKVTPYQKSVSIYEAACQPKTMILAKGGFHTTPLMRGNVRSQWTNWATQILTG